MVGVLEEKVTTRFQKCLQLRSRVSVDIHGDSDDAIVDTAVFFGTLLTPKEDHVFYYEEREPWLGITFNDKLNFDADRSERLAVFFGPASSHKFFLESRANEFLSAALATRPFPINLTVDARWIVKHS